MLSLRVEGLDELLEKLRIAGIGFTTGSSTNVYFDG